MVIANPV